MSDDMIKALAAKDGVIQINNHIGFLTEKFRVAAKQNVELMNAEEAEAKKTDVARSAEADFPYGRREPNLGSTAHPWRAPYIGF